MEDYLRALENIMDINIHYYWIVKVALVDDPRKSWGDIEPEPESVRKTVKEILDSCLHLLSKYHRIEAIKLECTETVLTPKGLVAERSEIFIDRLFQSEMFFHEKGGGRIGIRYVGPSIYTPIRKAFDNYTKMLSSNRP